MAWTEKLEQHADRMRAGVAPRPTTPKPTKARKVKATPTAKNLKQRECMQQLRRARAAANAAFDRALSQAAKYEALRQDLARMAPSCLTFVFCEHLRKYNTSFGERHGGVK